MNENEYKELQEIQDEDDKFSQEEIEQQQNEFSDYKNSSLVSAPMTKS